MRRLFRSLLVAGTAALAVSGLLVGCGTPPAAGPGPQPGPSSGVASGSAVPAEPEASGAPDSPSPSAKATPAPAPERPYAKTNGDGSLPPRREASNPPDRSVPESEVVRLEIPDVLTGDSGGAISPDPATNELVPPKTTLVYRWAERGRPGSDSGDTVYLLGHTVRAGGGVFDPLQHVGPDQSIIVQTEQGTLTYRVQATKMYPKNEIQRADEVYEAVPGRLVLVGCYLNADGSKQDLNFVVFAQLAD